MAFLDPLPPLFGTLSEIFLFLNYDATPKKIVLRNDDVNSC